MGNTMDMECCNPWMERSILENGKMVKGMEKVYNLWRMMIDMKEILKMTLTMEKVHYSRVTEILM